MDCIYCSFNDNIDTIGVGSANVVTELGMAIGSMILAIGISPQKSGYTDKFGILKGKKRRFVGRMRDSVGRCLRQVNSVNITRSLKGGGVGRARRERGGGLECHSGLLTGSSPMSC